MKQRIFNTCIILLLIGCSNPGNKNDITPDDVFPFEGKLLINISRMDAPKDSDTLNALIHLQTEEEYGCYNYLIEYTIQFGKNDFLITLGRVVIPGVICLTAIGPANTRIPIGLQPGSYSMTIGKEPIWDVYELEISDESISLIPVDTTFSVPADSLNF